MMGLPNEYIENMKALLGDEFDAYMQSLELPVYRGIRFNRLKCGADEIEKLSKMLGTEGIIPWCPEGFYLKEDVKASLSPLYSAGLYYIQEPSAMAPAEFLPVTEGDHILDLCAAPGGKSTRLCADAAFLLSNDISASRARALVKNLELFGSVRCAVTAETPDKLAEHYPEFFDSILVDAPCSGEGMFKKDPSLISSWEERGPEYYHGVQTSILMSAYAMLRPGGYILYSTCTFSEQENEGSIGAFLESFGDMELVELPPAGDGGTDFRPGLDGLSKARRLYPFLIRGEGHFIALMKKRGESEKRLSPAMEWVDHGERTYLLPAAKGLFVDGLRYLKRGICAGETNRAGKFKPSQAFALALRREQVLSERVVSDIPVKNKGFEARILNLEPGDPRVIRYLRGETIEGDINGTTLICVAGHPLGFGRGSGGRIKNDLAKGYIWQ